MTVKTPQEIIARAPMGRLQILIILLCTFLSAIDGFDILAISYAAPGIAQDWNVSRAALGIVLSVELAGMAVGSLALGSLADAIGRRPTLLVALGIMTGGMYWASLSHDVTTLSAARLITGFAIGGTMAVINAVGAEFANQDRRSFAVTTIAAGYPIGAVVGGGIASLLLATMDWRAVFFFGALATAVALAITWFLLPESVSFLAGKGGNKAKDRINATLRRMGHETVSELTAVTARQETGQHQRLFSPELMPTLLLLTFIYFTHMLTFFFVIKWVPKIVVDMGFSLAMAGSVLVAVSFGGIIGSFALAWLTRRFPATKVVAATMLLSAIAVAVFGSTPANFTHLLLLAGIVGIFANGGTSGLYAIFAQSFPTAVRAGGTGFAIGVGRGAAALGPIMAGFMMSAGYSVQTAAIVMAVGSLLACMALLALPARQRH